MMSKQPQKIFSANGSWIRRNSDKPSQDFPFWVWIVLLALVSGSASAEGFASCHGNSAKASLTTRVFPCQYSVRDVAFVNVHGPAWQLQLIKPDDVEAEQFDAWNKTLREKLVRSNVSYVWVDFGSRQADWLQNQTGIRPNSMPMMVMTGFGERVIPVSVVGSGENALADELDRLLSSPARRKILDNLVDTLCVLVLVESTDTAKNIEAKQTCADAIRKLNDQMWALEKPTDRGPVLVKISADQQPSERWLLESLGIDGDALPGVAIIYGQGRKLGETLSGDELTVEKILGRASLCGSDCECNLDRDWLYACQMIHVWDKQHERAAEQSLNFDPHSAFVIAEVAQIIQKNLPTTTPDQRINLGAGLIIHDLDPIPNSANNNATAVPVNPPNSPAVEQPAQLQPSRLDVSQPGNNLLIPWSLVIGLLGVLVATIIWFQWKATSR
jgi:hypothetical protein